MNNLKAMWIGITQIECNRKAAILVLFFATSVPFCLFFPKIFVTLLLFGLLMVVLSLVYAAAGGRNPLHAGLDIMENEEHGDD